MAEGINASVSDFLSLFLLRRFVKKINKNKAAFRCSKLLC